MIQNASVLGAVAAAFLLAALPFASGQILPGEREWDCSRDHAPHGSNSNRFLQSASGIFSGAAVVESSCATKLQVFSQLNGRCRCVFAPKLRALLEQPCHARLVPGMNPQEYEVLVPTLDRETIEELYVRKSCYSLLTDNIVDFFLDKGVNPLFFNLSRCRCDWTPESDAVSGRPAGEGEICERLVDQNFTSRQVSSDEVGNWISVFPFSKQRDMPVMNDGTVFGDGLHATVGWGLMGADFKDIHIVARFISSPASTGRQTIVTNICQNSRESRGFFELTYSPEQQQYSLRFFKQQTVTCTPDPALGGYSEQTVEVIYRRGNVRLEVNGFPCDVSTLNPVASLNNRRIQFNTLCPLQLGGAVFTDLSKPNFGNADTSSEPLRGVYKRFMAVRNCEAPPRLVLDRIQGLV